MTLCPIVKCTDPAARINLIRDLKAMGFRRPFGMIDMPVSDREYIGLANGKIIGYTPAEIRLNSIIRTTTLVNSPAHFIAYVRRAGIKPTGA